MEFEAIVGLGGFGVMLAMILAGVPIFVTLLSVTFGGMLKFALIICVIGVLLFGVYPNLILDFANQAASVFHY